MDKKSLVTIGIKSIVCYFGLFCLAIAVWTEKNFGIVTIDQTLSTLNLGAAGVFSADSSYVKQFVCWCLLLPLIMTFFIIAIESILSRFIRSTFISKFIKNISYTVAVLGIIIFTKQFNLINYAKYTLLKPKQDFFKTYYVDPNKLSFTPRQPKNLVLIYVESLETTYSDQKLFGHDLLDALNKLDVNKLTFKHYAQMPGTGWTMAAMISTQCGIPLKEVFILKGNSVGKHLATFLPGATCMSDILAKFGYKNVFMDGASLSFAGKGKFLLSHHYTEVYGRREWLSKGYKESDMNSWGLPDDELFKNAKIKLAELIKQNRPFNLTVLTVDTHGPHGLIDSYCKKKGQHDFTGVVECSVDEIAEFVNYIKQQGWLDKLNIVILGDHLAMQNDVFDKLNKHKNRYVFNMLISNDKLHKNTDDVVHFDMFPTMMEFLGFHYANARLGLGYSAIAEQKPLLPENRNTLMREQIGYPSKIYNNFWIKPKA